MALKDEVRALVSERVVERQRKIGAHDGQIEVLLLWGGTETVLAATPSGSLSARRDMIVSAITDLCMEAVDLHDCCEHIVDAVSSY